MKSDPDNVPKRVRGAKIDERPGLSFWEVLRDGWPFW
jgi:hypothetical protein